MTQTELVKMAQRGERIPRQPSSLHDEHKPGQCPHGWWRTIVCDAGGSDLDVVECRDCGEQKVVTCNFDDEYD